MIVGAVEDVDIYVYVGNDIDLDADTNIDDADTDTNIVKTFFLHLTEQSLIISHFFLGRHGFPFQGHNKIST